MESRMKARKDEIDEIVEQTFQESYMSPRLREAQRDLRYRRRCARAAAICGGIIIALLAYLLGLMLPVGGMGWIR